MVGLLDISQPNIVYNCIVDYVYLLVAMPTLIRVCNRQVFESFINHLSLSSAADRCKEVQQIRDQHPNKIPVSLSLDS